MCANCRSSNQGAYGEESNLKASPFTNNLGSQSGSGSVNETDLNNAQDVHFEGIKATSGGNKNIGKEGFGS
jgi:hypothetical protein